MVRIPRDRVKRAVGFRGERATSGKKHAKTDSALEDSSRTKHAQQRLLGRVRCLATVPSPSWQTQNTASRTCQKT